MEVSLLQEIWVFRQQPGNMCFFSMEMTGSRKNCLSDLHALREKTQADIVIGNYCHFENSSNKFIFFTSDETYYERTFTPQELLENLILLL